jgi:radical SAM enzyme (TIGR01210 family)
LIVEGKRLIIPLFIAHLGCPFRCIYCNQGRIIDRDLTVATSEEISEEIERCLQLRVHKQEDYHTVQVAFYGGSFTALPIEIQRGFLRSVAPFLNDGRVHSVRISTRPDYCSPESLDVLKRHGVVTIELGVQSMDDEVLRISERGYSSKQVKDAVRELHRQNFEIGMQLMIGLPGDSASTFVSTVEEVIELRPHFIRLYPTLVIQGTQLEGWFREGHYRPLSLEEAVSLAKEALRRLHKACIPVIRVGLQPTPSLNEPGAIVAGPFHPAFRQLVESVLLYEQAASLLECAKIQGPRYPTFLISPKDISTFYGQRGENIRRLREAFGLRQIQVRSDPHQTRGQISLCS